MSDRHPSGGGGSIPAGTPASLIVSDRPMADDEDGATMTATLTPPIAGAGETLERPASEPLRWWITLLPLTVVIDVAGLVLAGRNGTDPAEGLRFLLVLAWAGAGTVLAVQRSLCRLGVLLLAGTAVGAASFAAAGAEPAGWTGAGASAADPVHLVGALILPAIAAHLLLALPTGILGTAVRRWTVGVLYAAGAAVGLALAAGSGRNGPALWAAAWLVALVAALPGAHQSYLRTAGLERQRLQWVGCGAALAMEAILVVAALKVLVDWPEHAAVSAGAWTALIPLALGASASPRLAARVDRVLVHAVSVTGLTLVTVAVYLVTVVGLGRVPDESDRGLFVLSLVAAAVAAALYRPARERLADVANRLVYGERHAPDEVLRTFGTRLSRAIPMDELLLQLAESLRKTMALRRAEVWTGTAGALERAVSVPGADPVRLLVGDKERPVVARAGVSGQAWVSVWLPALLEGRPAAQLRVAPVVHSGELLGLVVVERPADGDRFTEEDDRVLAELARQTGLALHNVQLDSALQASFDEVRRANEELRASRARIVATADGERRKIERNLHDGAQQHLVALAVNLRLARDLLTEDPGTAAEMLDQLGHDVKETIAELRNLAHGIYPPLLVDAGLGPALRAAGDRSPLAVDVVAEGIGRYPGDVEAAVYFCCLEALQNAAKHAAGARVTIRLLEEAGGLRFEVIDDGPGFDADVAGRGQGFTNMADRLGAIGGSVRWTSEPGQGAKVAGALPLVGTEE